MYDYGADAPGPPTQADWDKLDELVAAECDAEDIVAHMRDHGIPLQDFVSRGRKIKVAFSTRDVRVYPGQEAAAKEWLAGRKLDSAIRSAVRKGKAIPQDVFDLEIRMVIRPTAA